MITLILINKKTGYNSDGLIKCLPQPGTAFQSILKSMPLNSVPFIKSCVTGQFRLPGQHHRAAGRRPGASFFALHLDSFIVTRNFAAIYRDLLPFRSFTVTRSSLPSTGTGKKTQHPDTDANSIKPPGR